MMQYHSYLYSQSQLHSQNMSHYMQEMHRCTAAGHTGHRPTVPMWKWIASLVNKVDLCVMNGWIGYLTIRF